MPQPRNITPKRLGKSAAVGVSAKALVDSGQGSAMEQPAPFRTMRREKARERKFEKPSVVISMLLPEIGFDQFGARGLLRLRRQWRFGFARDAAVEELR